MGILDSIFGRKKPSAPEKQKVQKVAAEPRAIPTVMNYERSSLQKYVDTKQPVLVIGGKYNQKQVVIVSNPEHVSYTKGGKTWPCATINEIAGDEPEPVRYLVKCDEEYRPTGKPREEPREEAKVSTKEEPAVSPKVKPGEKYEYEIFDESEYFNFNEIKEELPYFIDKS